jgi:regulator of protease activity HflC (stomatin/prohibitin superfamily)
MTVAQRRSFSKVKEVVAAWSNIRQLLRSGEDGHLVPVVIPRERRSFGWLFWFVLAFYILAMALYFMIVGRLLLFGLALVAGLFLAAVGAFTWWRSAIVEIEQGTTGIYSRYGKIEKTLEPGRNYLWWPWEKVEFIVDTSTEIPYTAPVLSSPTRENVPLKSIEFFLKFRIVDPVKFVQRIGASNFDVVLSSAVQDAIRQRSREVETAAAYDLRGSNVENMQEYLNRQMERYGVRILGANIPDVQLPDQYRENLATRERVAKELAAYEKEWELIRKRRTDTILMEIERAKKERDEKIIAVRESLNKAREEVAQMLQEREAEAEKIRLDIEAKGRANLKSAENEARALISLGKSYQDNQAVLHYELEMRGLQVGEELLQHAPRPVLVNSQGTEGSALSTLLLAQILPKVMQQTGDGDRSIQFSPPQSVIKPLPGEDV